MCGARLPDHFFVPGSDNAGPGACRSRSLELPSAGTGNVTTHETRSNFGSFSLPDAAGLATSSACIGVEKPAAQPEEAPTTTPGQNLPFEESLEPGATPSAGAVKVDTTQRFQVLEGFGASAGWFQDRISGAVPDGLYDFLFPESARHHPLPQPLRTDGGRGWEAQPGGHDFQARDGGARLRAEAAAQLVVTAGGTQGER